MNRLSFARPQLLAIFTALFLAGCNCGGPTVTSIAIEPADPSIERGATVALKATATLSDGTVKEVTADAQWSSADPTIAVVANTGDTKGTVTGSNVGKATIKAIYLLNTTTAEAETSVTVTAPPKGTIVVTPRTGLTTTESGGTATYVSDGGTAAEVWAVTPQGTIAMQAQAVLTDG